MNRVLLPNEQQRIEQAVIDFPITGETIADIAECVGPLASKGYDVLKIIKDTVENHHSNR